MKNVMTLAMVYKYLPDLSDILNEMSPCLKGVTNRTLYYFILIYIYEKFSNVNDNNERTHLCLT